MSGPVLDEPDWDNHRPKSMAEETGLPSYESLSPMARRPSFDVATKNGAPLPAILIPGIDPAIVDEVTGRITTDRRLSYPGAAPPLQIESSRPSTNYHRPQVEEVQDVQLYQPQLSAGDQMNRPKAMKKKHQSSQPPIVKPMPIHGERDNAVPAINASENSLRKNSSLNLYAERKPIPNPVPGSLADAPGSLAGTPFSPDSYDAINPRPIASLDALAKHAPPQRMIVPGVNRVYDPTDVLLPDSFAPEPEVTRRRPRPPPPVPMQHRRERVGRSISPVPPRGPRLSLPAPQHSVKQVSFEAPTFERREPPKSVRGSKSMASLPRDGQRSLKNRDSMSAVSGGMVLFDPRSERERQRQMERDDRDARALVPARNGGGNYGYRPRGYEGGSYGHQAPPQVPAKIPIGRQQEEVSLSQELSLISIGAGDGFSRSRRGRY